VSEAFRGELLRRLATAVVALPLVLAGLLLGPPWLGLAIVGTALALGLLEFHGLMAQRQLVPLRAVGFVLLFAIFFQVTGQPPWLAIALWPVVVLLILVSLLARGSDFAASVPAAALTLLGSAWLGALGGTVAALRLLTPRAEAPWRLLLLFATIMVSDTAAYFVGKAVGRTRMAPAVSPGKTVEGAVGGLLGGVLGALAVRFSGLPGLPLADTMGLGASVAALGMAGDLVESLFKRWAGVKDSGRLFPGHGGMLDRLDSLLFGAPLLYYYFTFVR
jgi:phosphatidate cytidylyltransferase